MCKLAIEIFVYSSILVYLNLLFCLLLDALLHAGLYIKGPCFFVITVFPSLITVAQLSSTVESTAQMLNRNIMYTAMTIILWLMAMAKMAIII